MVPIAQRIRCGHGAGGHSRIVACVPGARRWRPRTVQRLASRNGRLCFIGVVCWGRCWVLVVSTGFSHVLGSASGRGVHMVAFRK